VSGEGGSFESFHVTNPRDGVRLHTLRWGHGPRIIVALHGLNAHGWHWRRTAERLGPEYSLVSYDLRGHGESDKPETGYSYADQGGDLDCVVRSVAGDRGRPLIVGHSLGARIAMPWVTEHDPAGFAIVDPGIVPHVNGTPPPRTRTRQPLVHEYASREEFMERMRQTNFLRNWSAYSEEYAAMLIEPGEHAGSVHLRLTPPVMRLTMQDIAHVDLTELYSRIDCPALIIRATEGHLGEAMAARMHAEIRGSELVTIEGSNHNVMLDRPEAFDAAFEPFLVRVFGRS